jgi:AcrR family transcriptional regulator
MATASASPELTRRKRGRPPNPALRVAKHARMLQSAVELFIERGYEHVTVEQVACKAGQSKGAFYWYFKDKEDCLRQIIDSFSAHTEQVVTRELGRGQTAREKLLHVTDFQNWDHEDFTRFAHLMDSMIYSRSPTVAAMGVEVTGRTWRSLHGQLSRLGRDAAVEAGWPRERVESFDFDCWAWACLATYAGTYEFINHKYFSFAPGPARLAKAIHAVCLAPLYGTAAETTRGQASP